MGFETRLYLKILMVYHFWQHLNVNKYFFVTPFCTNCPFSQHFSLRKQATPCTHTNYWLLLLMSHCLHRLIDLDTPASNVSHMLHSYVIGGSCVWCSHYC
ncbi:hypothetical protein XELAEV_18010249mg [Xenopus laevis]|uniref:Uncharacterized protein n=1 Tax=Xenopus laevis TaxID=8355 RepID=A0A974DVH8_XENLA|nr:hypothetical protein XELAEV_18010249mg [Xenopus laevis]